MATSKDLKEFQSKLDAIEQAQKKYGMYQYVHMKKEDAVPNPMYSDSAIAPKLQNIQKEIDKINWKDVQIPQNSQLYAQPGIDYSKAQSTYNAEYLKEKLAKDGDNMFNLGFEAGKKAAGIITSEEKAVKPILNAGMSDKQKEVILRYTNNPSQAKVLFSSSDKSPQVGMLIRYRFGGEFCFLSQFDVNCFQMGQKKSWINGDFDIFKVPVKTRLKFLD